MLNPATKQLVVAIRGTLTAWEWANVNLLYNQASVVSALELFLPSLRLLCLPAWPPTLHTLSLRCHVDSSWHHISLAVDRMAG
jgi:hypothetical protein